MGSGTSKARIIIPRIIAKVGIKGALTMIATKAAALGAALFKEYKLK
jgi:ABC-type transporter Mla maintaining outer membrane lipid asymmetry permease subunit MlaE